MSKFYRPKTFSYGYITVTLYRFHITYNIFFHKNLFSQIFIKRFWLQYYDETEAERLITTSQHETVE